MPARQKLNSVYFSGCLALYAVLGLFAQWLFFLMVLAVTVGVGVHLGDIRPSPDPRVRGGPRPRRRRR